MGGHEPLIQQSTGVSGPRLRWHVAGGSVRHARGLRSKRFGGRRGGQGAVNTPGQAAAAGTDWRCRQGSKAREEPAGGWQAGAGLMPEVGTAASGSGGSPLRNHVLQPYP